MSLSAYAQHTVVVNPDGTHTNCQRSDKRKRARILLFQGTRLTAEFLFSKRFNSCEIDRRSIYLFAEHRRHQILPGLVRDGDIGFQGIVVFVTGEGHFHRTNTKRTIDFDYSPK